MTSPNYQKMPKLHKTYAQLLKEEAKKRPNLYGDYIKAGKIEVEPRGFHYLAPTRDKNYFNRPL